MIIINKNTKVFTPRSATLADRNNIFKLYKKVSRENGGISRMECEITTLYVSGFMFKSLQNGIELVIEHPYDKNELIAEIHGYKLEPNAFGHILSELTIVVDPLYQGLGIGKLLFTTLLDMIKNERNDIFRVETRTRETNTRAIDLYKKMGFIVEGRFENRLKSGNGHFETDIPMAWFNNK